MWIVSFKKILFLKKNFYLKFTVCSVKRLFHKFPQIEKENLYTFHWKGIQVAFGFVSKPNRPWCRVSKLWQQGGILDFTLEKSLPGRDFWNSWKYAFVESEPQFHITATIYKTEVGSGVAPLAFRDLSGIWTYWPFSGLLVLRYSNSQTENQ